MVQRADEPGQLDTEQTDLDFRCPATAGAWRVPDCYLHLAGLLGGWPGAFLYQRRLRHKFSKVFYQVVFWFIVVIFQIVAADVMLDQRLSQALMRYLAR